MKNIATTTFGSVKIGLPYGMMLTRIFKHFNVPLDGQISLKSTHFDELTFGHMDNEMA